MRQRDGDPLPDRARATLARVASRLGSDGTLPDLTLNARLRSTRARYLRTQHRLELSPALNRAGPSTFEQALAHELAHALVTRRHPGARPHGQEWRDLMRAAGFSSSATCRPASRPKKATRQTQTRRPATPYEHRCPVCQTTRRARTKVTRWRCANCVRAGLPGHLIIEKPPANTA